MSQLYCGDCQNYLMGSDGQCHDCVCGWNQPVETYEKENTELETEVARLQKENVVLKATISNLTKAYERESNDCLKALEERDYWYEKTDSLADKISEVFDVPIGEHSNVNCPFDEANKILDGEYVTKFDKESAAQAKRIEELEAATEHLGLTPQQAADGLARHKAQVAEIESLRKQVEALGQTAPTASGFCSMDGGCVCGGDLPRIRESCGSWVKPASKNGE